MWMDILKINESSEFWLYDPSLTSDEVINMISTSKEKVVFNVTNKANGFPFDIEKFTDLIWKKMQEKTPTLKDKEWRDLKGMKSVYMEEIIQKFLKKYSVIMIGATENDWREVLEFLNRYQHNQWYDILWGTIFAWPYPKDKLRFSANHSWIIGKVYYVDKDKEIDRYLWKNNTIGDSPENMWWWKNE